MDYFDIRNTYCSKCTLIDTDDNVCTEDSNLSDEECDNSQHFNCGNNPIMESSHLIMSQTSICNSDFRILDIFPLQIMLEITVLLK